MMACWEGVGMDGNLEHLQSEVDSGDVIGAVTLSKT